ncbi:MAG: hypothetical protein ACK4IX_07370 [Candidatus Sericytochromatia bacterium]
MKKRIFLVCFLSFIFNIKDSFCEEEKITNRKNSIELSIPLAGFNIKYSREILEEKDFFTRVALEPILFREESRINNLPNITSKNSLDLEIGLNNYFNRYHNFEKDIKSGSYFKTYLGSTTNLESAKFNILPYIGTGIGFNYNYGFFGATFALDILTTIQSSDIIYIGGVLFVRPEINLRFSF